MLHERGALSITQEIQAYPQLVRSVMPPWALGFFAAALVGSVLSSFNSALNSAATLFTLEVYHVYDTPNIFLNFNKILVQTTTSLQNVICKLRIKCFAQLLYT